MVSLIGKKKAKTKDKVVLPKSAQDTVPYTRAYELGIIESTPGYFTKSYKLTDINFKVASQDDQDSIFEGMRELYNSYDANVDIQITINNRNVDEDDVMRNIMCRMEKDKFNEYRQEYNEMLKEKMHEGKNNITSEKYFTIGTHQKNIKDAASWFNRVDADINRQFAKIAKSNDLKTVPLTLNERLKILHDIMNVDNEKDFDEKTIDFDTVRKQGLSTKDIIAPAGFRFNTDSFRMGDKFARTLFIKNFPSNITTDFMSDLCSLSFNFVASFNVQPIPMDKAMKMVKEQMTNIRGNVIQAEKNAFKAGYSGDLISPTLKYSQEQAEDLLDEIRDCGQKLFYFNVIFLVTGDSNEELKDRTAALIKMANKYLVSVSKLTFQQEAGFRSVLPLARNEVAIKRLMTTDAVSVFLPFTTRELTQKNGMYYGLNAVSNNMIIYNRLNAKNQNGVILGMPGSGKSFSAKREMINVFLTTKDDIYVIDPESEYSYMCQMFGGEVIHIEPGSQYHINPFDMDIHYGDDEGSGSNPVTMKSDFICMLCETAMGKNYELSSTEKSIIDRVVNDLYKPYMKHMMYDVKDKSVTCDIMASPTMTLFYDELMKQEEPEAREIALSLEIYCVGNFDTFAQRTNVEINNRFTVFDIKNIGTGMKELGLMVCLNHIWNKIISNQGTKNTWFYIDEFHVLTKTKSSADFLMQIWKRARKWGGIPTAITQNVVDLMTSEAAMAILNNTEFVLMLAQSPVDRMNLANMYNIPESQLTYITDSPPGQGLLYTGMTTVPFIDKFPTNTKLYKAMSSKASERKREGDK